MANDSKKISQLAITTSVSPNDRLVVLTSTSPNAQVKTITGTNFGISIANSFPIANSSHRGTVQIGSGLNNNGGLISVIEEVPETNAESVGYILTTNASGNSVWSRFTGVHEVVSIYSGTSYTISEKESVLLVNPSLAGSDVTIILPIVAAIEGKEILIKVLDATSGHKVIVTTDDPNNAFIENPTTGAFVNSYDLVQTGQAESWIHDGNTYRHLNTARATPIFYTDANNYSQVVVKNNSIGINASSDLALYNNLGDEAGGTGPYIDIGIDGSNYSNTDYSLYGPNDGYVYVDGDGQNGGNLLLGTARDTSIILHAGGVQTNNKVMTVNSSYFSVNTAICSFNLNDGEGGGSQLRFNEYGGISNRAFQFDRDNFYLPNDGTITDSFPIYRATSSNQYDQLYWSSTTLTFTNAANTTLLDVLSHVKAGDRISLDGVSVTVTSPYTGGFNGTIEVNSNHQPDSVIGVILLPDKGNLKDGIRLTKDAHSWTFSGDGFLYTNEFNVCTDLGSNAYTFSSQTRNSWEAFPEDDTTGPYPAWAWIRAELPDPARPVVFIENKNGATDETHTWAFQSNGALNFPGMKTVIANGNILTSNVNVTNGFYISNSNVYDDLLRPLLNPNALDINADGGTSTSVFAVRDEAFTGGGSTTVFGRYEAALDGGVSFNNRHSASYIDGGGANVL